MKTIFTKVSI